jgi:hypothetical protein
MNLRVNSHPVEKRLVLKGAIELAVQDWPEVDYLRRSVLELYPERERRDSLEIGDPVDFMPHHVATSMVQS